MTHKYTLLVGGRVLPGGDAAECSAIAWAAGTVLMVGSDAAVRALSRGDSAVVELRGAFVVPAEAPLEIGGPADAMVFDGDPRSGALEPVAVVVAGRLVAGSLPGLDEVEGEHGHEYKNGDEHSRGHEDKDGDSHGHEDRDDPA